MFTKRLLLAAVALAAVLPLVGCRHHCHKCSTSSAPPCCGGMSAGYMPPPPPVGAVPPPAVIPVQ